MSRLTPEEAAVLRRRFYHQGVVAPSHREIGRELGRDAAYVGLMERRALLMVRAALPEDVNSLLEMGLVLAEQQEEEEPELAGGVVL